ncbi:Nitrogenase MoFe cofactor biosynthesis protein NifE [Syntrophomonas zehnderi OL-4]|uniref:Nitrogenase iron-molybdenum cofactor biosynthesis protein NifE n=1 Tax=Syntrophomonas zehnderi OL-4 TaxID=690567 RepID=A0A0E4C8T4_9FIRM|nr:Nitrogenase MoFe cofactor biosynthesis protein NifE [Syntrophomonas zehnderi OL-4]
MDMAINQTDFSFIPEREKSIRTKGQQMQAIQCQADSVAGCVSQRACVYCGARVVLNPITDAVHLVHGPIGCASYTWDIRGSLSSGADLYRHSFSTDLREEDIIFGGERKLMRCIDELAERYHPPVMLVYSTCIVGVIGDDLEAVCRLASKRHRIKVIPVQSSGFSGNKSDGYRIACEVLLRMIASQERILYQPFHLNYLGDYNLAGEAWIICGYLQEIGINVNVAFTGDSRCESLLTAPGAALNIVQCAGSMGYLAKRMEEIYGIPFLNVSFLGLEDTMQSLRRIADFFANPYIIKRCEALIERELAQYGPIVKQYRQHLKGKKAAVFVGGGFKAISLIKQFRELGMEVVMVGTQTGRQEEYDAISQLVAEGTVILDDANPSELERFMLEQGADLLVGGVKERPLAYKLGLSFIDHNHERKHPLSGFTGAANFAREVEQTVCSPVWKYLDGPIHTGRINP